MALSPGMSFPDFLGGADPFDMDLFDPSDAAKVYIGCERRRIRVVGFLASELELSINSSWSTMMGGSGSPLPGSVINGADSLLQLFSGTTIRQPWFSRGMWQGIGPTQIPLTINFYAFEDAKTEVWDKVWQIVNLFLPARLPNSGITGAAKAVGGFIDGGVALVSSVYEAAGGKEHYTGNFAEAFETIVGEYAIPGPSPLYSSSNTKDHVMFCYIGNLAELSFEACYFTDLSIKFPASFNGSGYPQAASVSLTVNTIDSMYLVEDGQGGYVRKSAVDVPTLITSAPAEKTLRDQGKTIIPGTGGLTLP